MYKYLKALYYRLPFRREFYLLLRNVYSPSQRLSGYLKFKGAFTLNASGARVKIFNNNATVPSILFWKGTGGYEKESLEVWIKLAKNAKVIFDVGANFGLFGLISKAARPEAKVYFFEPLLRNQKLISRNLVLNSFEGVVEGAAVSDFEGKATFYDMDSEENTIASFNPDFIKAHSHHKALIPIEVPVISLDSYIEKNRIQAPDLVKIDVEGVDYQVMKGFVKTLKQYRPTILIEITNKESADKINQLLKEEGLQYRIFEIDEAKGLTEHDHILRTGSRNFLLCNERAVKVIEGNP